MSLTDNDLLAIRTIVREEIKDEVDPLKGKVEAIESDVKEIYFMLARTDKKVDKISVFLEETLSFQP
jgi:dynactin complex subunit